MAMASWLQSDTYGVGVSRGSDAILHDVNRLTEDHRGKVGVLMLLVDFNNAFNLVDQEKDSRSKLAGIFPPNISRPLHGVKLLGGPVSVDIDFISELVMKKVAKTIKLMDAVAKINDPQCVLLLLRACTGILKLYFDMRKCPPCVFKLAQRSFDVALRFSLERIVIASRPGFGDWQWRLATLPFAFGGLGVYSLDIYFTWVTKTAESTFSLTPRQMALWKSQLENYTSDSLRVVSISGISAAKEVDIGMDEGRDKPLRPTDMLLYLWDEGLDVRVDLTESSPLTQTEMTDFLPGLVVIDAAHHKRVKYETKCASIRYGFLHFSFSSLGELEEGAIILLKRIRKFFMTHDIEAHAAVHIFKKIDFAIAKGVGTQIISWLPINFL
nr:reverse transcriptase domain-containing protein [Tanacetum cinerariifolium]